MEHVCRSASSSCPPLGHRDEFLFWWVERVIDKCGFVLGGCSNEPMSAHAAFLFDLGRLRVRWWTTTRTSRSCRTGPGTLPWASREWKGIRWAWWPTTRFSLPDASISTLRPRYSGTVNVTVQNRNTRSCTYSIPAKRIRRFNFYCFKSLS